jgi:hypothetical protein
MAAMNNSNYNILHHLCQFENQDQKLRAGRQKDMGFAGNRAFFDHYNCSVNLFNYSVG